MEEGVYENKYVFLIKSAADRIYEGNPTCNRFVSGFVFRDFGLELGQPSFYVDNISLIILLSGLAIYC